MVIYQLIKLSLNMSDIFTKLTSFMVNNKVRYQQSKKYKHKLRLVVSVPKLG